MESTPKKHWLSGSLIIMLMVVIVDQVSKVIVLKTMYKGQSIPVFGDWLRLTFTENPGMAFGIQFGPPALITIFSLIATVLIIAYLYKVGGMYKPYRFSLSFVLGGAFGNIIDRVFYGKILYDDPYFLGKVVDFIHVNVWRGVVPEGVPFLGGKYLALFPIWNVADMAIVLGVVGILFFQRQFHALTEKELLGENSDETQTQDAGPADATSEAPAEEAEAAPEPQATEETPASDQASPGETSSEGEDPGQEKPL